MARPLIPPLGWYGPPKNIPPAKATSIAPGNVDNLASTGGISGASGALLVPIYNAATDDSVINIIDPTNLNTEEACFYFFRQEEIQKNAAYTSYKMIIDYFNIGVATFTIGIITFRRGLTKYTQNQATIQQGTFSNKSRVFQIGTVQADGLLYSMDINIVNSGERPQIYITRKANAGPLSITNVSLYGLADEQSKV